jgi:hypothetical protein
VADSPLPIASVRARSFLELLALVQSRLALHSLRRVRSHRLRPGHRPDSLAHAATTAPAQAEMIVSVAERRASADR